MIETAVGLFNRQGFHAVGVDAISERAGITKKTLYHHFKSKEDLILAALRCYDERFRKEFMQSVEIKSGESVGRLLAVFDVVEDWFNSKNFSGCLLVGAMGEYPDEGTLIRNVCQESKRLMLGYIKGLAKKAKLENGDALAEQMFLLIEGAITMAQVNNSSFSAVQAKEAAKILIKNSTP